MLGRAGLALLLVVMFASTGLGCEGLGPEVRAWEAKIDGLVKGEADAIFDPVPRAFDAVLVGDSEVAVRELRELEKLGSELRAVPVPREVAELHQLTLDLVGAARQIVSSMPPRFDTDGATTRQDLLSQVRLDLKGRSLLDYYRALLRFLEAHHCDVGDIEMLRSQVIPELEGRLTAGVTSITR